MQHWYVYYKLPRAERDATIARVRLVQERVARTIDVRTRLLERTEQGETTTVMEVYEDIADAGGFAAALDDALRGSGLSPSVVDARRVERFRDA